MDSALKTLNQHNQEAQKGWAETLRLKRNGIACPQCGAEMLDSSSMTMLMSFPPQKNVHCAACGYSGYRVA